MALELNELIYDYCNKNDGTFKKGNMYLRGNEKSFTNFYYINSEGQSELPNDTTFTKTIKRVEKIDELVCIYEGQYKLLEKYKKYAIFKTKFKKDDYFPTRHLVIPINNIPTDYPADYFISIDKYNSLVEKNEFEQFIKEKTIEIEKVIEKRDNFIKAEEEVERLKAEEKKERYRKDSERRSAISLFENIANALQYKNDALNKYNKKMMNYIALSSLTAILFIITTLLPLNFLFKIGFVGLSLILIIANIILILKLKKEVQIVNKLGENFYDYKKINRLPYDILGKIKFIENSTEILKEKHMDFKIIELLEKTTELTLKLSMSEEDIDLTLKTQLEEYLNSCIEYIEKINSSKEFESEYISGKIVENIQELITKNNKLFNSMVEDHDRLYSFLKK